MKKRMITILFLILVIIFLLSCELSFDDNEKWPFFHFIVTVSIDLDSLNVNNVYYYRKNRPDTIMNIYNDAGLSNLITIYPVTDTGNANFCLFKGICYDHYPITVYFVDSLTIYTPIDTTILLFSSDEGSNSDTIIVNPSIK